MEFKGERHKRVYTLTVNGGKVRSILVEAPNSCERELYQRGPTKTGRIMNENIFEEAVLAICQKNLISWMDLFDAIWDDKVYGQDLMQKVFKKHLK